MQFPAIDDTIIAVSSGWRASPTGIVRLSGPESVSLVGGLGVTPPGENLRSSCWCEARLELVEGVSLPATVFWFRAPRSYTGQDLVELHTVGCLPLLRDLCARLIESGARRALPGEFTARAFLSGRLNAEQVEGVLATIHTQSETVARRAGRSLTGTGERLMASLRERVTELLALVEAGIDFAEEEDVRFIAPVELHAALDGLVSSIAEFRQTRQPEQRLAGAHVALAGSPNAGKSTLFNALIGRERAIVSPVLGTTRDVLSAEIDVSGMSLVLQDCAGLGGGEDALELAAHRAAERAADQADLVLWVHAADMPWQECEGRVVASVPSDRRLLVWSKTDLAAPVARGDMPVGFVGEVRVSAVTGKGLGELRELIHRGLAGRVGGDTEQPVGEQLGAASVSLRRALELVRGSSGAGDLADPASVAFELRTACECLSVTAPGQVVEEVLERIFSQFCIGK